MENDLQSELEKAAKMEKKMRLPQPSQEFLEREKWKKEVSAHILNIFAKYECSAVDIEAILFCVNCEVKKTKLQYKRNYLEDLTHE